jgi:hypothetical protein
MRLKKTRKRIFPKGPRKLLCKKSTFKAMSSGRSLRLRKAWQTVYNDFNRCKNGQLILCDTHLGPPSFWTSSMKAKLKRLVNNRKGVSQPKFN